MNLQEPMEAGETGGRRIRAVYYGILCFGTIAGVILVFALCPYDAYFKWRIGEFPTGVCILALLVHSLLYYGLMRFGSGKPGCSMKLEIVLYLGSGFGAALCLFGTMILPGLLNGSKGTVFHNGEKLLFSAVYFAVLSFLMAAEDIIYHIAKAFKKESRQQESGEQESGTENLQKGTRTFVIAFCILAGAIVVKNSLGWYFRGQDIYFRAWIEKLDWIAQWILIPSSVGAYLIYLLLAANDREFKEGRRGKVIFKKIGSAAVALCWFGYLIFAMVMYLLVYGDGFEIEKKTGDLLAGTVREGWLDAVYYTSYYEEVTPFSKKRCLDTGRIVQTVLRERYQDTYEVTGEEKDRMGIVYVKGRFEDFPETEVRVVEKENRYGEYEDDRGMAQAYLRVREFYEEHGSYRRIEPVYQKGLLREIEVYCAYEEWEEFAAEAARLIGFLMQDPFLREHGGYITFVCGPERDLYNYCNLSYGDSVLNLNGENVYADRETVYQMFRDAFEDNIHTQVPGGQTGQAQKPESAEETEQAAGVSGREPDIDGPETGFAAPEAAFARLYETSFASEADGYQDCYNAKGNYYALLGTGKEELDGVLRNTVHTVVYDRESQNGKCLLFVEYKEYLDENETGSSVYTTRILEFYAVNKLTGKTAAAGKTAWDQVGSPEYRDMTGE